MTARGLLVPATPAVIFVPECMEGRGLRGSATARRGTGLKELLGPVTRVKKKKKKVTCVYVELRGRMRAKTDGVGGITP